MKRVKLEDLREKTTKKLLSAGIDEESVNIITDILLYADLRGIHSHGVLRVKHYVNRVSSGGINLSSNFNITKRKQSIAIMDADGGFGHVAVKKAMDYAIDNSKENGLFLIGIKNNSHIGALSYYNKMAIDRQKISLIMANTDPCVIPFNGKRSFFGTNPISFGFPARRDFILGDMATSEVSLGRIFNYSNNGKSIPPNWGVDENGESTTDPNKVKALIPFGGAKGYMLQTMIEAFSGILIGNVYCNNLVKMYNDLDKMRNLSTFILVIEADIFNDIDTFLDTTQSFIDDLRNEPSLYDNIPITVPGDRKEACRIDYEKNGIAISDNVYNYLFS